jgi:hypothetical protein
MLWQPGSSEPVSKDSPQPAAGLLDPVTLRTSVVSQGAFDGIPATTSENGLFDAQRRFAKS